MDIQLKARTLENALTYFERTKDPDIEQMFPRSVLTREQAIANFQASLLPDADSFGQTIWATANMWGTSGAFASTTASSPTPCSACASLPRSDGDRATQSGNAALSADGDRAGFVCKA